MGLETETTCTHQGKTYKVKALLESTELILRGELKRKLPLVSLNHILVNGSNLNFESGGENYSLALGVEKSVTWAKKIATPPPSLAKKLGLSDTGKAFVIGAVDDAELEAALKDNTTASAKDAALFIAVTRSDKQLNSALKTYGQAKAPIWLINVKGANSSLGENAIRAIMRERGFMDTKTCMVSASLAATRYNRQAN